MAEIEGFGEVVDADNVGAVEVGDGLGDLDAFEVGTSREVELFRG